MKPSIFDRVQESVDPAEYFRDRLPTMPHARPRGDGWTDGGLCPFHDDRRPGSFRVNVHNGMARCFSCAAKAGDIIAFEAALGRTDMLAAAVAIADEWGIDR